MIDMVPPFLANEPYSAYFDKLGDKMQYVHLCNSDGVTEAHLQLDEPSGQIPIADFFRVMKRYNYKGWVSIEILAPYFRDPEMYLAGALRIVTNIFKELNIKRS
jgi:protein FrlC